MKQILPPANATFDATAKTITFAKTIPASISHVLHVANVTRGVLYFQPQGGLALSGTYASPVLTLLCSTAGHADADDLLIFYDDGLTEVPVTFPVQHIDSFSRVRTAEPGYRFDNQLTYQVDTDLWDTLSSGGSVAHSATERWALLTANALGANSAIMQSHYHSPYTPGRGQLVFVTFLMGDAPAVAGHKRVGYFDGTNGIYLERTPTDVNIVSKSSTTYGTETVAQADWNVDPMDGTGPSGLTLDLTKVQILVIAMQALYVGRVMVAFDINGELVPVHQFLCANNEAVPYIAQASLPIRYEVAATISTTGAVTLSAICGSVISEGGADLAAIPGRQFPSTGTLANTASGTVLVIRAKSTFNSINSNVIAMPTDLDVSVADAGCWINVRLNPTVTAGTFTDVGARSAFEESFAGNAGTDPTVNTATGTLIDRFWLPASAAIRTNNSRGLSGKVVLCYSHLLAAGDVLSIDYDGGGATTDVQASLKWKEIR